MKQVSVDGTPWVTVSEERNQNLLTPWVTKRSIWFENREFIRQRHVALQDFRVSYYHPRIFLFYIHKSLYFWKATMHFETRSHFQSQIPVHYTFISVAVTFWGYFSCNKYMNWPRGPTAGAPLPWYKWPFLWHNKALDNCRNLLWLWSLKWLTWLLTILPKTRPTLPIIQVF